MRLTDAAKLAADLRRALAHSNLAARLSPKISVAIDGGGALGLDELSADVRLRAELVNGDVALRVGIGGDGASAMHLGFVAPADGVETAIRLLEVIAQRGRAVRARDILAGEGIAPFQQALPSCAKDVEGRDKPGHDGAGAGRAGRRAAPAARWVVCLRPLRLPSVMPTQFRLKIWPTPPQRPVRSECARRRDGRSSSSD